MRTTELFLAVLFFSSTQSMNAQSFSLQCGSAQNLTCVATSVVIGATADPGVTFLWSGPGISGSITGSSITVNAPGFYNVIATSSSDGSTQSCSIFVQQDISVPPQANAGGEQVINCFPGSQVTLNPGAVPVGEGIIYGWTPINGGNIVSGNNTLSPLVDSKGCYILTVTKLSSGCTSTDTVCVAYNLQPACSLIVPNPLPYTGSFGNTLNSNSKDVTDYEWSPIESSDAAWTITAGATSPAVIYSAGSGTATFKLVITNGISGCKDSCSVTFGSIPGSSNPGEQYCTWSQGFFGNSKGKTCNGLTSPVLIGQLLSTPLTIGGGTNSITFTSSDVNCLINRLPGGGPPVKLSGVATCSNPTGISIQKNGHFGNILLNQTITLGLDLRISGTFLGSYVLPVNGFTTYASAGGCGTSGVPVAGTAQFFSIPQSVLDYLGTGATVQDLYNLANQALAGTYTRKIPSLGDIASAENALIGGFDECRVLDGSTGPHGRMSSSGIMDQDAASMSIHVSPNPFTDKTSFEIAPYVTYKNISVELYDLNGKLIHKIFNGSLEGSKTYRWDIDGTHLSQGVYIYRVAADDGLRFGKIVLMK